MKSILKAFAADGSGATAIEYGALVMFIGLALLLALEGIGVNLDNTFKQLKSIFAAASSGATG